MRNFIFGAALLATAGTPAYAAPLTLLVSPSSTTVQRGQEFSFSIVMTGLTDVNPREVVTAYDLGLAYNPAIIQPLSDPHWIGFSGALDVPTAGPSLKFSTRNFEATPDWITYYAPQVPPPNTVATEFGELSWDLSPYAELFPHQGNSLLLATLKFKALAVGMSDLLLIDDRYRQPPGGNVLDIKGSTDILIYDMINGKVTVSDQTVIPEIDAMAGTGALTLLAGMLMLARERRRC